MLPGSIPPGTKLDRYRVLGELGRGGMGVVLKAQEEGLDRIVAIKVLPKELVADPKRLERFRREAKGAAAVTHPSITTLYTFGEANGWPYMVFEFMGGGSLHDKLKNGPLPWREAVKLMVPIARALGAIHAAGLIHRDLKPANILLDAAGRPKLGDFGLVRNEASSNSLTGAGELVGTASYLAPEQADEAGQVDFHADLYSFGVTLFTLLTGTPPFTGEGLQVIAKHLTTKPAAPSKEVPGIPKAVDRIVLRLLEKKPELRGIGADALADELEQLLGTPSGSFVGARGAVTAPAPRGGVPVAVWAVLAVAVLGAAGFALVPRAAPPPPPPPAGTVEVPPPELALELPVDGQVVVEGEPLQVKGTIKNFVQGDVVKANDRAILAIGGKFDEKVKDPRPVLELTVTRGKVELAKVTRKLDLQKIPDWYTALPKDRRPRFPLPKTIRFLRMEGENAVYLHEPNPDLKMEMVYVPAGEFQMGEDLGSVPPDTLPIHAHLVAHGYWIGRCEVTWSQYRAYTKATWSRPPAEPPWFKTLERKDEHPVVNVSWDDAKLFCEWARAALPDEGQWEKAARGTDERRFPWGGRHTHDYRLGLANLRDNKWPTSGELRGDAVTPLWNLDADNDPYVYTAPVGSFPKGASPYGALDMAGNVNELCLDCYDKNAYGTCKDGVHDSTKGNIRVIRGGSFDHPWTNCQSATRGPVTHDVGVENLGLRIVVEEK